MTAEIAVMNRRAIAFAADSAMTISSTGKTYNSADKIFELSASYPIGLMLYNSLDYMDMPLDVIIKNFRDSSSHKSFSSVAEVSEAFFRHLQYEFSVLGEDEDLHVDVLASVIFDRVAERFYRTVMRSQPQRGKRPNMNEIFTQTISRYIAAMESLAFCDCYFDLSTDDFVARYSDVIDSAISEQFSGYPIDDNDKSMLKRLVALSLQKSHFSPIHTGFVLRVLVRLNYFLLYNRFNLTV